MYEILLLTWSVKGLCHHMGDVCLHRYVRLFLSHNMGHIRYQTISFNFEFQLLVMEKETGSAVVCWFAGLLVAGVRRSINPSEAGTP